MPHPINGVLTRQASSRSDTPASIIQDLKAKLPLDDLKAIVFFCSPQVVSPELARLLKETFPCPVIGCTSAGQIDQNGFTDAPLCATGLYGEIEAQTHYIDFANMEADIKKLSHAVTLAQPLLPKISRFGFLLTDGLSLMEEKLASMLYQSLPMVPFVGGSAGDNLKFEKTHVYFDGSFRSAGAVFAFFKTPVPFSVVKFEHYKTTDKIAVVTEAEPDKRIIKEFDGEPAADVYARLIGTTYEKLVGNTFTQHPLVLQLGSEQFVRDVFKANPDHSLSLFCAIEEGLVLALGEVIHPIETAKSAFEEVRQKIGEPSVILTCDCVSRKIDFTANEIIPQAGKLYADNRVFGFCTYGEQYNGIHINRTFTGIALGAHK